MKVKVCGITDAKDAAMCEELGADALGFVHVEGRTRSLPLDQIADVCSTLGPMTTKVLVCSPMSKDEALRLFERAEADVLQLHSLEPMDVQCLKDEGVRLIRAVRPDRAEASRFVESVDALLFESGEPGTGRAYDYSRVPVSVCKRPIIAGGLNLNNMRSAIAMNPYALDVSSGVEDASGKKDPDLVAQFVARCKE